MPDDLSAQSQVTFLNRFYWPAELATAQMLTEPCGRVGEDRMSRDGDHESFRPEQLSVLARVAVRRAACGRGRSDQHPFGLLLAMDGIQHRTTQIRSPRTNGFVERMNRANPRHFLLPIHWVLGASGHLACRSSRCLDHVLDPHQRAQCWANENSDPTQRTPRWRSSYTPMVNEYGYFHSSGWIRNEDV
jgi:hypothetical protein